MSTIGNIKISGSLVVTGSVQLSDSSTVTGSFTGDGSSLTGVTGSWNGFRIGDAEVTGSLEVSNSITASAFQGDGSGLTGLGSQWNGIYTGSASITGSLEVNGRVSQVGLGSSTYFGFRAGESDDKTNNYNTAFGDSAFRDNETGTQNTAVGFQSLLTNLNGSGNTALGAFTLTANEGGYNTAIGNNALDSTNTGDYNVAVGNASLRNNSSGDKNTALGTDSLLYNDAGTKNTAIGYGAGQYTTGSSDSNVFLGYNAGPLPNTSVSNKLYIHNNSGSALIEGNFSSGQVNINGSITASVFTGSFVGNGSGLTGITATAEWDGSRNGDSEITGSLEVTEDLTVGSQIVVGTSSGTQNPVIHSLVSNTSENILLESSDTGAGSAPDLVLYRNAGTPQDNDTLGVVEFKTNNAGGSNPFVWNGIYSRVIDASQQASALTISAFYGSSTAHAIGVHNTSDSTSTGAVIINPNGFNEVPQHTLDVKGDARITTDLTITGSAIIDKKLTVGSNNTNAGNKSTIAGGDYNTLDITATCSFIGGGKLNTGSACLTSIGGGCNNVADHRGATVGGGFNNSALGIYSTIGGGGGNVACLTATVAGGDSNEATGQSSFVGGGVSNDNGGNFSSILGGGNNCITNATSRYSAILGGCQNIIAAYHTGSFIAGQHITTAASDTTYVNNLHITGSTSAHAVMQISRRETTPTGVEGMIIASGSAGSSKLYYYNGTSWNALF